MRIVTFFCGAAAGVGCLVGHALFGVLNALHCRHPAPRVGGVIEALRNRILGLLGASIGPDSFVRHGGFVSHPENLFLGRGVRVAPYARLFSV